MEEVKRKPGRPFGTVQENKLREVKLRLDPKEYDYLRSWSSNINKTIRELIKQENDRHRLLEATNGKED